MKKRAYLIRREIDYGDGDTASYTEAVADTLELAMQVAEKEPHATVLWRPEPLFGDFASTHWFTLPMDEPRYRKSIRPVDFHVSDEEAPE